MKKLLFIVAAFLFAQSLHAQFVDPVSWAIEVQPTDTEGEVDVVLKATVEDGWYLYSKETGQGGPVPTKLSFTDPQGYELIGDVVEVAEKEKEGFDKIFEMNVKKLIGDSEFRQRIKITDANQFALGEIEYQTCNDESCLPPTPEEFAVQLSDSKVALGELDVSVLLGRSVDDTPKGGDWITPGEPKSDCTTQEAKKKSSWLSFLKGIGAGLFALLMPCLYPMIPLTVSFFTKQSKTRKQGIFNAGLYGLFITLISVSLSLPFWFTNAAPDTLNEFATSAGLNLVLFAIFIIFALSFFGLFEITLPSAFVNKVDQASNKGGIIGIFFMALTLVLVSFSCTGPILGTALADTLKDGPGELTIVLLGFGLTVGLPFMLFAIFPSWLNSMPKSGGWMETLKVSFGFIELAMALKFLSNADLVMQWGLLKREIFLGLWVIIFLGLALYLFGFIKLGYTKKPKIGLGRIAFGLFFLLFAGYLVPGVFGKNLALISGFPPPLHYSINPPSEDPLEEFEAYKDYDEALAAAKAQNKPLLVDFTGWACVNCRRMEENVWVRDNIKELMDKYVIASLYVDEKKALPEEDQYRSKKTEKRIRTVGNKWSDFEITSFDQNTQPLYALLSPDEELLNSPVGFSSETEFEDFLDCGLQAHMSLAQN
ncbi:MAG: thioredoxin family protein [Saprospiraceae bacterium]|nr:thioredoxin family protein [Saprospiraceae bacterium]